VGKKKDKKDKKSRGAAQLTAVGVADDPRAAERAAREAVRNPFEHLDATGAARVDRIVETTARRSEQRVDSLLATLTSTIDRVNATIVGALDQVETTASDVIEHLAAIRHRADELVTQLTATRDDANTAAIGALDRVHTTAIDVIEHLAGIRRHADDHAAELVSGLEATSDAAHDAITATRDAAGTISDAHNEARATISRAADEVDRAAGDVTAQLSNAREAADAQLAQLADRSARAADLHDAFGARVAELQEQLVRRTDGSLTALEGHWAVVGEAARQRAGEVVAQIELDAAAIREQRETLDVLVATVLAASQQAIACAADADAALAEIRNYATAANDAIDQVEEDAEDVRDFVDSFLPTVEDELAAPAETTAVPMVDAQADAQVDAPPTDPRDDGRIESPVFEATAVRAEASVPALDWYAYADEPITSVEPDDEPDADSDAEPEEVPVAHEDFDADSYRRLRFGDAEPPPPDAADGSGGAGAPRDPVWGNLGVDAPVPQPSRRGGDRHSVALLVEGAHVAAPVFAPGAAVSAEPVSVTAPAATLEASLQLLARGAAECTVRIEVIPGSMIGSGYFRMTTFDPRGWWECHDVAVHTDSRLAAPPAVVDAHELQAALADLRRFSSDPAATMVIDGNVTIANHLLLSRGWDEVPPLPGNPVVVERLELANPNGAGVVFETLLGRVFVPPALVGHLRRRQASTFDLVAVDGVPYLSASMRSSNATAMIVARLQELGDDDTPTFTERRATTGDEVAQLVRALSADTPPEELARILKVGVGYVRRRAAAHPALPKELIHELVTDGTEAMRAAAASNPSIGTRGCELAAVDPSSLVRAVMAANPAVPSTKLDRLAEDAVSEVRAGAASNPMCTPSMLTRLAQDPDATVRRAVASHVGADVEILVALSQDPENEVCAAVAENPNCPPEVLDELVGIVPDSVLANPAATKSLLAAGSVVNVPRLRAAVARNPATPARRLRQLARDEDVDVLAAVADHPQAPKSARRRARQRLDQDDDQQR
jgi:hypothetical protein